MNVNELKKDLRSLSGLLDKWRNVKNPNILQNIVFQANASKVEYSITEAEPLIFRNIDLDRHCLPIGIEKIPKDDINAEVKLTTRFTESTLDSETKDPFNSLGVNISVSVEYIENNAMQDANCSWHLDKGAPVSATFSHPEYHMNFGGLNMTKQGAAYGKLLLLTSPRIIHPPMDLILSCDFIIRNFYLKSNHSNITSLPSYIDILNRAKTRYWKPFSKAFYSHWDDDMAIDNLNAKQLYGH